MSFVEGLIISLLSTLFMTRVQTQAPAAMTGRVWGLASTITSGGAVTGILLAGAIAGHSGPPAA